MIHIVKNLHSHRIHIDLIGCGGTGSYVLSALPDLHFGLISIGHPEGIHVTAWDPDHVSESNIGRQRFIIAEIGLNKAECLIHRINMNYGFDWEAVPQKFIYENHPQIIIACVDSSESRKNINEMLKYRKNCQQVYVIDAGNGNTFAQVVIGNGSRELPSPYQKIPELLRGKKKNQPSCSLAEALSHQDLTINRWAGNAVLEILWRMFRKGELPFAGYFINLESGKMNPIAL